MSIAVDPVATENNFGPAPVSGVILTLEHLQEISKLLASTAALATGGGDRSTPTLLS